MKKHLSVIAWAAKSSLWLLLILCIVTFALQCLSFGSRLPASGQTFIAPENYFASSGGTMIARIAFLVLCALLAKTGCPYGGSRPQYLLQRLRISERSVVLMQSLYHVAALMIYWMFQVLTAFTLFALYIHFAPPEQVGPQSLLLMFYRNPYLHALLPLSDLILHLRNCGLLLILSFSLAMFPFLMRRGKFSIATLFPALVTSIFFPSDMGAVAGNLVLLIVLLCDAALLLYLFFANPETEGGHTHEEAV